MAAPRTKGGVEHAPRVDVSARSNEISQVPGDGGGSTAVTPVPPPSAPDLPGLVVDDPAAAGFAPARAVPDVSEAVTGLLGAAGLGLTVPEGPIVPGLTGLQLADPGALTPLASTLAEPRPDLGVPGLPESDQVAAGGGVPGGRPDATAGVPVRGGFGPPLAPPDTGVPFEVSGLQVPPPGGEQLPPLSGLAAPLPSAGVPGVPASDQVVTGGGWPTGPPDVTSAAAGLTGAELGPLPQGLAAEPDLPAPGGPTPPPPGLTAAPDVPNLSVPTPLPNAPGAPFTPTGGFAAPAPAVPALPADAAAAVPAGASGVADPTGPVDGAPVDGAPVDVGRWARRCRSRRRRWWCRTRRRRCRPRPRRTTSWPSRARTGVAATRDWTGWPRPRWPR